jgi:hypothetical protein
MEPLAKVGGIVFLGLGLLFVAPIIAVFFGALSGWIIGLVFTGEVMKVLSRFGVDTVGLSMWELGAGLGFVGSFFKSSFTAKKSA